MNSSFQIGKIMGIPIKLHWTFLFIIFFVAWSFGSSSLPWFGNTYGFGNVEPVSVRWLYSIAFAILLFICVALHELGHSFVAKKQGVEIKSITLYFFGGVAAMDEMPRNSKLELRMALAGPLTSGIIGLVSFLVFALSSSIFGTKEPFTIFFWTLGWMNLILMIFNLIPAFPMDGGRVLRAWFASRMPYAKATRKAAEIGRMFAILMFFLGLFTLNFFMLFIAFFVYMGASEEEKATTINISLEGIKVRQIMSSDVRTIDPAMTLKEIKDLMFHEKHRGYPVVEGGELLGIVTITDLQRVPEEKRDITRAGDVMARKLYVIAPEEEASVAMKMMNESAVRRLPVMDAGRLVGIVSREDLVRAIELCSEQGR